MVNPSTIVERQCLKDLAVMKLRRTAAERQEAASDAVLKQEQAKAQQLAQLRIDPQRNEADLCSLAHTQESFRHIQRCTEFNSSRQDEYDEYQGATMDVLLGCVTDAMRNNVEFLSCGVSKDLHKRLR